jgi:putative membrane protein
MMNGFDGGMMGGWGAFGWLWMLLPLLFWGGLLAVIVWAVMRVFPNRRPEDGRSEARGDPAEDVLRERFARGEVDAEEYERSLEVLRSGRPANNMKGGAR